MCYTKEFAMENNYLNIRLRDDLKQKLELLAERNRRSLSEYVRHVLIDHVDSSKALKEIKKNIIPEDRRKKFAYIREDIKEV
jgi:hypothetical protein